MGVHVPPDSLCVDCLHWQGLHRRDAPQERRRRHAGRQRRDERQGSPQGQHAALGDVMVKSDDDSIHRTKSFTAQVQVLNHPGELKVGYCPIAFIRTGRSAVRLSELKWKVGKETGGQKAESPVSIKAGEMGAVSSEPQQPFVVDSFKVCEGLGRVAIMEGNSVVMLGKATKTEKYVETGKK